MPINPKTLAALDSGLLQNGEQVLDGGPARCRRLDRLHLDMIERELGSIRAVRDFARAHGVGTTQVAEADWVATTRALYYISFHTRATTAWPWDRVAGVELLRKARFGRGALLRLRDVDGRSEEFGLNSLAATAFQEVVSAHAVGISRSD